MLSRSTSPLTGNFCFLLEGRERVHNIYHKPLTLTLFRVSPPWSARQQHHLSYLAEFTSSAVHVLGVDNMVAVSLSRPSPDPVSTPLASYLVSLSLSSPTLSLTATSPTVSSDPVLSANDFLCFCLRDAFFSISQPGLCSLGTSFLLVFGISLPSCSSGAPPPSL